MSRPTFIPGVGWNYTLKKPIKDMTKDELIKAVIDTSFWTNPKKKDFSEHSKSRLIKILKDRRIK